MSKMLEATCIGNVVSAGGVPVPSATILSEGIAASNGVLILDEDKAKYIAKTSPDLKETLEKLVAVLESIASALTSIDTVATLSTTCGAGSGSAIWVPVATADIIQINTIKAEIEVFKEALK